MMLMRRAREDRLAKRDGAEKGAGCPTCPTHNLHGYLPMAGSVLTSGRKHTHTHTYRLAWIIALTSLCQAQAWLPGRPPH